MFTDEDIDISLLKCLNENILRISNKSGSFRIRKFSHWLYGCVRLQFCNAQFCDWNVERWRHTDYRRIKWNQKAKEKRTRDDWKNRQFWIKLLRSNRNEFEKFCSEWLLNANAFGWLFAIENSISPRNGGNIFTWMHRVLLKINRKFRFKTRLSWNSNKWKMLNKI